MAPADLIPPITDPQGRYWEQPDSGQILVDDKVAMMTEAVFLKLPNYSCSNPTGVYPGKMWRRAARYGRQEVYDKWYLCWYGLHATDPENYCTTKCREIILVD
jgi:hypothetical protein